MSVTFHLPPDLERALRSTCHSLEDVAKEAALVELYRLEKMTQHELAQALGISRLESEAVLKAHGVSEDLPTDEELARARRRLSEIHIP